MLELWICFECDNVANDNRI